MKKSKNTPLIFALSFLLPALAITLIFALSHFYPFGEGSVLITDMDQQYVDYFAGFRKILLGEDGIFYTWNSGLGMNYLGIYAYYLSSPFAFLILLFPQQMITEAILFMIILKVGCAGPAFLALLKRRTGRLNPAYLIFSCAYALMSFCVVYFFNIMWLDAVILLPIICIGLHRLLEKNRSDLFISSLFVLFYSNFYISFMTGIAVFMYFLMIMFFENQPPSKERIIKITIKFFAGVLLAAGLSAVLLLPAYKALSSSYVEMTGFSFTGYISANPIELIEKSLPGVFDSVTTYGLPNIYCGIFALVTLPLFFLNREISRKQKIYCGVILGLFVLSFISYDLAVMWHVFRAPTWFNARHSFTYCFFVILISFITLCKPKGIKKSHLGWGFGISIALVAIAYFAGDWTSGTSAWVSIGMILLVYVTLFLYISGYLEREIPFLKTSVICVLLVCSLSEAVFSGCENIKGLDDELGIFDRSTYTDFIAETQPAIDAVKKYEEQNGNSALYRTENADMRWSNDNLSLSYRGMAHYSSLSNQHTFRALKNMGVLCVTHDRYLRYYGNTSIIDTVLGIKYVISKDSIPDGYTLIGQQGDYGIYQNPKALEIGFGASSDILDYSYSQSDPFAAQNNLISALKGEKTECFTYVDDLELTLNDLTVQYFENGEFYVTRDGYSPYMLFEMTAPKDGEVYLWLESSIAENCSVFVNDGPRLGTPKDDYLKGVINLGTFSKGDNISVKILFDYGSTAYTWNYCAAVMNSETVDTALSQLSEGNMTDITFNESGTVLKGKLTMKEDGALFTTIPYDEGWRLFVNGEKKEYASMGDKAFIVAQLEKGDYDIEFRFTPMGFKAGLIISCVSLLIVVFYLMAEAKKLKCRKPL